MDNISHTLVGVAIARGIEQRRQKPSLAILWTSVLANNLPDADLITSLLFEGGKLNYLLHHRGHSHTLLLAPILGVLAAVLGRFLSRSERSDWRTLIAVGIGSTALHIFMDSWNIYGVHPFWPFDNRWYYGDFIFIVEPLLWFSIVPLAFFSSRSKWGKATALCVAGLGLGLSWFGGLVPLPVAIFLTAWLSVMFFWQFRSGSVYPAIAGILVCLASFRVCAAIVLDAIETTHRNHFHDEKLHDIAMSPAPANPFCWQFLTVSHANGEYIARWGNRTLGSGLFDPASCQPRLAEGLTAPLQPVRGKTKMPTKTQPETNPSALHSGNLQNIHANIHWFGEFRRQMTSLHRLTDRSCEFSAFLLYARIPFWLTHLDQTIVGDLRYDREKEQGFAEFPVNTTTDCSHLVLPGWEPPLGSILRRTD